MEGLENLNILVEKIEPFVCLEEDELKNMSPQEARRFQRDFIDRAVNLQSEPENVPELRNNDENEPPNGLFVLQQVVWEWNHRNGNLQVLDENQNNDQNQDEWRVMNQKYKAQTERCKKLLKIERKAILKKIMNQSCEHLIQTIISKIDSKLIGPQKNVQLKDLMDEIFGELSLEKEKWKENI